MEKQGIHVAVVSHYEVSANLEARLRNLLTESRAFSGSISPEDLAGLDQFHAGGLAATAELSELLTITRKTRVLDVGSGLGGPSRYLAYRFGCHVWGVELSESYCQTARMIARLMELDDEVSYQRADALNLPFQDHSFDIVWTSVITLNPAIRDRVKSGHREWPKT